VSSVASIDGVILAPEEARVSVYDRGFLYGDSVFETIRTYGGEPFALSAHLVRLALSAAKIGFTIPVSAHALAIEVRKAVRAARNAESYIRITVTRGSGPLGLDPALARAPVRVILVEPLAPLPAALYRDGVSASTMRVDRPADVAPGAKIANYLASLLAIQSAKAQGAHEALLLDARGEVIEGATSNVFVVQDGALITPPEEAGILAGITRAQVLTLAEELGVPVRLATFPPAIAAQEAFLTSSLRELLPLVRIDAHQLGDGAPGPVTRALHAAFRGRVGLGAEPMPWEPREGSSDDAPGEPR
jgi:branched-chain amino acid aminotransferase